MAERKEGVCFLEQEKTRQMVNSVPLPATATKSIKVVLLDLPPEVLIHIFLHLPFTSVVICQGINRHLQALISESAKLQYYVYLGIFGLVDNPQCSLPVSERLDRLFARERRWEDLDFDFDKIIDVPAVARHKRCGVSARLFSILYQDAVHLEIQIPSEAVQGVRWKRTFPERTLINGAKRVYDHDLCIIITAQPRTTATNAADPHVTHEVQVHLNQSSTGKPHPDAQRVISFEIHEQFEEIWASVECVGNNLVLVIRDRVETHKPDNQVYVYEWKTGELKLRLSAPFGSYLYPLFLTMRIFVLPNATTGELEYWRIPQHAPEPTSEQPFLVLSLPRLSFDKAFDWIACRAEPGPTNEPQGTSKPFGADPHHAIVIFDVVIRPADRSQNTTKFAFFVHRSSLVRCMDIFSAPISSGERLKPVPYDAWGPPVCRWFNESVDGYLIRRIAGAFGQRYIASATNTMAPLLLLNFNQVDVAKVLVAKKRTSQAETQCKGDQNAGQDEGRGYFEGKLLEGNGEWEAREERKVKEAVPQTHGISTPEVSFSSSAKKLEIDSSLTSQPRAKAITRALDPLND
ncbi:hypothetical protein P691DRAFT_728062, partial [Macrolepiota fuliginosa MF-IS2]